MTKKAVQFYSAEYCAMSRNLTPAQRVKFLEDFAELHRDRAAEMKLISIKVPSPLLRSFRSRCELMGLRYQTQIKKLMEQWVKLNEIT